MICCHFCKTPVADVDTAVSANWIPSFFDDDTECAYPVCPSCVSGRLEFADDGEFQLAEHTRYADEAESAQRGNAWPQAAALWSRAAELCQDAERRAYYEKQSAWANDMVGIADES